jgi:hypothetical protein
MIVFEDYGDPGYEGVLTTTSATGFPDAAIKPTSGVYANMQPKAVKMIVETASINCTEVAGGTPTTVATTDIGYPMGTSQNQVLKNIQAIKNFKCINQVASSGAQLKYVVYF